MKSTAKSDYVGLAGMESEIEIQISKLVHYSSRDKAFIFTRGK
jgi:hypothetical protein